MNIAIFSPSKNPYSETFIQAHKNLLKGSVFYYFGEQEDIQLEGSSTQFFKKSIATKVKEKTLGQKKSTWSALKDSLITHQIDVILVEYGNHAHELLPLFGLVDIPFIVHFHGYDATVDYVLQRTKNYKEVFHKASAIIAVSTVMVEKLKALGCPEDKLHYNVYGPQSRFLENTAQVEPLQFIAVGRFANKKAPYFTIMAFAKALENYPEAQLVMVGDGELLNTCVNLVKYLKIENSVTFAGVQSPAQVEELMQHSRALVQHSITALNGDQEGTPLSILEASAIGLPVISTKHAGISDVIKHGETGLLCEEGDVDAMALNMKQILGSYELAKSFGENAKDRIKEHFSIERHIEQLHTILKSACES